MEAAKDAAGDQLAEDGAGDVDALVDSLGLVSKKRYSVGQ